MNTYTSNHDSNTNNYYHVRLLIYNGLASANLISSVKNERGQDYTRQFLFFIAIFCLLLNICTGYQSQVKSMNVV